MGFAQPASADETVAATPGRVQSSSQNPAAGAGGAGSRTVGGRRIAGGASPAMGFGGGTRTASPNGPRTVVSLGATARAAVPPVVIRFSDEPPDLAERRQADLAAMTRNLEQALEGGLSEEEVKPETRMLLAGSGRSVRAMYVEGLGPLFMIKVDFPLLAPPKPETSVASATNAESDKALVGSQRVETTGAEGWVSRRSSGARYNAEQVEALKTTLLAALKQGTNLRDLKPDEFIAVSVFGPAAESETRRTGVGDGSVLSLRVRKSDVDAFAKGGLSLETFRSRATPHAYAGAGHGVTSVNTWLQSSHPAAR